MTAKQSPAFSTRTHPRGSKNRGFCRLVVLSLCLLSGAGTSVFAQDNPGQARSLLPQNNLMEQQDDAGDRRRISQREASEIARERFPGRVLSIRLDNRHWRVRMDQEGNVFNVLVDAESGAAARAQD